MGSGVEIGIQQPKMESESPVQGTQNYPNGPVALQAHYMGYNYPDPQYSPQTQDAYYAMQNVRHHSDANPEPARHSGRGPWGHN